MKSQIATLVFLGALLVPSFSHSQQSADAISPGTFAAPPSIDQTEASAGSDAQAPTVSDVSKAITSGQAEMAASSNLDATLKSSLQQLYQSAQQNLDAATASRASAARYAAMSRDAQTDLAQLNKELKEIPATEVEASVEEGSDSISQKLAAAHAELTAAANSVDSLAGEPLRRQKRLTEIPDELAAAQKVLSVTSDQLALPAPANETPIETRARVASLRSRSLAAKAKIDELQKEQSAYASTSDVLPLRRTLADQRADALHAQIDALQAALVKRQKAEVRDTTNDLRDVLARASEPLKPLAQNNVDLSEQHQLLISETSDATKTLDNIREATQTTATELKSSQERVKSVGLTDALGLMLRTRRRDYEQLRQKYLPREDLKEQIQDLQVLSFQLEDELSNIDEFIAAAETARHASESDADDAKPSRVSLLKTQKQLLRSTLQSQNTLLQAMLNGDTQRRLLLQEIDHYVNFIDEQVFWIRSAPAFSFDELRDAPVAIRWAIEPASWLQVMSKATQTSTRHPLNCLLGLFVIVALIFARPRLRHVIEQAAGEARRYNATIRPTIQTLGATVLLAGVWPALFLFGGILLADPVKANSFVDGVSTGLLGVALFVVPRTLLREACRDDGLGDAHFGWNEAVRSMLRFHLQWYMWMGALTIFFLVLWHSNPDKPVRVTTECATSMCLFAMFAVFCYFVFHPRSPMFVQIGGHRPNSTIYKIRHSIWAATMVASFLMTSMSMAGYLDTAFQIGKSIQFSVMLLVFAVLLVAFVFRWLTLRYRDIAIKQAREKRVKQRAAAALSESGSLPEEVGIELVDDETTDLPALDRQTRQTVSTLVTVFSLVALALIWRDVLPAFDVLDRVQLGSMGTGSEIRAYTLKDIFYIAAVVAAIVYAIRTLPGVLEMVVLQRSSLNSGARYAWTTILRYLLIIAGALIVMKMLSVPYQQLGWLLAAASVGLGFGMQEIFANFVSGIILLLERPVRVGDVVTIGDTTGIVSRIQMRATTVTSWDRKELVVPNKDLITEKLLNWSLSNVINRVTINVGVDYSADPDEVREILERVVGRHPDVMEDPAPLVNFEQFGDNSLNFAVRFFLANLDRRLGVTHEINASILRSLRSAKINIPFPQRDLHIKVEPKPQAFPIELRHAESSSPDVD